MKSPVSTSKIALKAMALELEALEEPCSYASSVNDDIILEVEEDAPSTKENKMQDKAEDVKQSIVEEDQVFGDVERNKQIELINKDYDVKADIVKSQANKLHVTVLGQGAQTVAQGLSELKKSKSQKESLVQQVQQDNQNQQENTGDGIKKEIDKLADFDPFQRNSSSQR